MVTLPCAVGAGFKPSYFADFSANAGPVSWIEVHAENYLCEGGAMRAQLFELRLQFPVSLHGVGLSLGGEDAPDAQHLQRLRTLSDELKPAQFSEHLAWSQHNASEGVVFANDLLPVAYDDPTLSRVAAHIDTAQQALGQRILIENPSLYLAMTLDNQAMHDSPKAETDFLSALVEKTGCGLLVDVNNIFVTCQNLGWRTDDYLEGLAYDAIGEVHLAGHAEDIDDTGATVLIDNHGGPVADAVWAIYTSVLEKAGPLPSLVEWDTHLPDWAELRTECVKADAILRSMTSKAQVA